MLYRNYPKGDARRYLLVLATADEMKDKATLHHIAEKIGANRAEVQRALAVVQEQFSVRLEKQGSVYKVLDWGILKNELVGDMLNTGTSTLS